MFRFSFYSLLNLNNISNACWPLWAQMVKLFKFKALIWWLGFLIVLAKKLAHIIQLWTVYSKFQGKYKFFTTRVATRLQKIWKLRFPYKRSQCKTCEHLMFYTQNISFFAKKSLFLDLTFTDKNMLCTVVTTNKFQIYTSLVRPMMQPTWIASFP